MLRISLFSLMFLIASVASAHPGHGELTETAVQSVTHYMLEPVHAACWIVACLAAMVLVALSKTFLKADQSRS